MLCHLCRSSYPSAVSPDPFFDIFYILFQRLRACTNTVGAFECGACLGGNTENAAGNCTDFDECMNGVHDCIIPGGFCENKPGSFECPKCMDGFVGPDGRDCTDIDECDEDSHDCNVAVVCKNTIGEEN